MPPPPAQQTDMSAAPGGNFAPALEQGLKQIPLSSVIYELGPHVFARVEAFAGVLRTPKPSVTGGVELAICINETEIAECLLILLKMLEAPGTTMPADIAVEKFVDALCLVKPYLAWVEAFTQVGELLSDKRRWGSEGISEMGWMLFLRAWQRARIPRTGEDGALPADIPPQQRQMFPLSVLPHHPSNRLLSSLVKFLVVHDERHGSTLIPQTLLHTPPSNVLLEVAHNLFYTHAEETYQRHGLDLLSFLTRRLSNPKECHQFLIKIGVFLQEKLTALTALYVAAAQGRDPLKTIDNQTTLILDATKTITYFQAVMNFADAADASDVLFSEARVVHHFERLRLMAVDVYREDAAVSGLDRRSFLTYLQGGERRFNELRQPPVEAQGVNVAAAAEAARGPAPPTSIDSQEEYFFSCFYRRELSAAQLVELLARLASCPPQSQEAQLLSKMLRTLFTECRHFPKYPPSELSRTAEFFGKLIRSELLMKRPELQLLATRCVMEALRKEPTSNIFKFGLAALQEFLELTPSSPVFLASLTKMPGLIEHFPHVVTWAQQCLAVMPPRIRSLSIIEMNSLLIAIAPHQLPPCHNLLTIPPAFQLVPQIPQSHTLPPGLKTTNDVVFGNIPPPFGSGAASSSAVPGAGGTEEFKVRLQGFGLGQVEALMDDAEITHQIEDPPDQVKSRVAQVFNTLAKSNVPQKAQELLCVLQIDWFPWLAFYIVKSRASKEPNHHELYAEFAESLGHAKMIDLLTNVTYDCVNLLLKFAVSARDAISYRTVVKTLGSWLGRLTIARNKPLKSKSMDIKALLYDSYERGNLIVTVPLVCAILAHVKTSRTFKMPNPWTASALYCLGSLYQVANLKQTIHFEIELLMRNLELDLNQFLDQEVNLFLSLKPPPNSPDLQQPKLPLKIDTPVSTGPGGLASSTTAAVADDANAAASSTTAPSATGARPKISDTPATEAHSDGTLLSQPGGQLMSALSKSVVIAPSLVIFQRHPELKIAVSLAIERAIRQLVNVISERAVILAVGTTVELVQKDFALESDPDLVKRAANLMAAALGGSIVSVTGRSPLKLAIIEHLKDLIKSADSMSSSDAKDDDLVNQTAQVVANDNLGLASLLIEQVVVEQSIRAIQEALATSLEKRRQKKAANEPFVDPVYYDMEKRWPKSLPPLLQLTPNLDPKKLHIYSDFASIGPLRRVSGQNSQPEHRQGGPTLAEKSQLATDSATSRIPLKSQPLSPMPAPHHHISPKQLLTAEQSLAAIDQAVASLKEGVKELISSPMILNGAYKVVPVGHLDHMIPASNLGSPALRALAILPTDHEVFKQMEIVVRLIRHCEQQDDVALSTARRLLRSIYDAAHRAVQHASVGDAEIDISLIYLETFVALLKRFDELQLVHRLKDVVTIWIVSASYLALTNNASGNNNNGSAAASQEGTVPAQSGSEKATIDFRHFPVEIAAHALLVLATAWKYGLLQISVIDNDFLVVLMKQSMEAVTADMSPQVRESVELTIEFVLSVAYTLKVDLESSAEPGLVNTLELIQKLASAIETNPDFQFLKSTKMQLPRLLEFQERSVGVWTLDQLTKKILEKPRTTKTNETPRILTIQDLLKFRNNLGVPTYSYLTSDDYGANGASTNKDEQQGASSSLAQAFQNGQLRSKKSISYAIAHSIRESLSQGG